MAMRQVDRTGVKNIRVSWRVADLTSAFSAASRPSIAFYEQILGATPMKEWTQERLELDGIRRLRTLGQ